MRVASSSDSGASNVLDISATADGGAVVTMFYYGGDFTFAGTTLPAVSNPQNYVMAKLNSSGVLQWIVDIPDGTEPTVASDGSVVVSFSPYEDETLGAFTIPGNNGRTLAVASLSAAGTWEWATSATVSGAGSFLGGTVVPAGTGFTLGGIFKGDLVLGADTLSASPDYDGFVARLDAGGNWDWSQQLVGTGDEALHPQAGYSGGGTLILADIFGTGTSAIDGVTLPAAPSGRQNHFLKISNTGNVSWVNSSGYGTSGQGSIYLQPEGETSDGDILFSGRITSGSWTLGSDTVTTRTPGQATSFLAKLSSAGSWSFATRIENLGFTSSPDVVIAPSGQVYVTGFYSNQDAIFGSTTLPAPAFGYIGYIAALSSGGSWDWATSTGGGCCIRLAAASLSSGKLAVFGEFEDGFTPKPAMGDWPLGTGGFGRSAVLGLINLDGTWPAGGLSEWPASIDVTVTDDSDPIGQTSTITLEAAVTP